MSKFEHMHTRLSHFNVLLPIVVRKLIISSGQSRTLRLTTIYCDTNTNSVE
jgi:hypothetical protein